MVDPELQLVALSRHFLQKIIINQQTSFSAIKKLCKEISCSHEESLLTRCESIELARKTMLTQVRKLVANIAEKTQRTNLAEMAKQNEKAQKLQKSKEKLENQKETKKKQVRNEAEPNNRKTKIQRNEKKNRKQSEQMKNSLPPKTWNKKQQEKPRGQ